MMRKSRKLLLLGSGFLVLLFMLGLTLLPIRGQVVVIPGDATDALAWPRVVIESQDSRFTVVALTEADPKVHVAMTLDGRHVPLLDWRQNPGTVPTWTWRWRFEAPNAPSYALHFFHDCAAGCLDWTRVQIGRANPEAALNIDRRATKLCAVWANPERNWHNRAAWSVELTYAAQAYDGYNADDLAWRVWRNSRAGLRTLVRVDYDKGQTIPPTGDYLALERYLGYLTRLARDVRLRAVYAFIVGSGFNERTSNVQSPEQPVTPEWYARVFNGYGEPADNTHNAVQAMRAARLDVRVLVGPVRPWVADQTGARTYAVDAPWLNYMNTVVAALDEAARAKAKAGISLAAPDGFALNAFGRPNAPEMQAAPAAEEPQRDLRRAEWNGAQAGFRVYRDWLAIINSYPSTRGLPVYITASNTFAPGEVTPPAQNYPTGWLTSALAAINAEPQVQSLCWFMDWLPDDASWDAFSLTNRQGKLGDAADEFDALLR
ncbi:hypothetical protein [Candidatus Roseilinea sp. NK_OTU-006]|jgi:hypothetical protein|uniref:hypothetical protein n=1 Tax=Candidatus Roseilinea sp. NK_OTU-006 TaxID=2704250 RepID=UPI00145EBEA9|nr:hypothetical protein [Candidatus Roseilinea sp. NK_OTU-006]